MNDEYTQLLKKASDRLGKPLPDDTPSPNGRRNPMATIYRPNHTVPKPSAKVAVEDKKTFFIQDETRVEVSDEDPNILLALHPELDYQSSVIELKEARALIATGGIHLSADALTTLLNSEVPVIFFDRNGGFLGRIEPKHSIRSDLLHAQATFPAEDCLKFGKFVTWGMLRNVRGFLSRHSRSKEGDFKAAVLTIDQDLHEIFKSTSPLQLFGYQGRGMKIYYELFEEMLSYKGWGFQREKRNNPLNRMLNFVHSLFVESAHTALIAAGLNPQFGLLYRDKGLSHDLAAEYRSVANAIVISCINHQQISLNDFDEAWDKKLLPVRVAKILLNAYENKMSRCFKYPFLGFRCSYQESFFIQAQQIALLLSREIEEYCPLSWR